MIPFKCCTLYLLIIIEEFEISAKDEVGREREQNWCLFGRSARVDLLNIDRIQTQEPASY